MAIFRVVIRTHKLLASTPTDGLSSYKLLDNMSCLCLCGLENYTFSSYEIWSRIYGNSFIFLNVLLFYLQRNGKGEITRFYEFFQDKNLLYLILFKRGTLYLIRNFYILSYIIFFDEKNNILLRYYPFIVRELDGKLCENQINNLILKIH